MKKFIASVLIMCCLFTPVVSKLPSEYVESDFPDVELEEVYENFVIYDNSPERKYITEKRGVSVGDLIIDLDFNEYEVIEIYPETHTAIAKFNRKLEKPSVNKKKFSKVSDTVTLGKIGLYSTHNDESYIIGDGTESVYGKGGIHDIGNLLKENLVKKKIDVVYDETLHIPHNSSAYSRSRVTANNLLKSGVDAIFDIHRDGASRSFYYTEYKGKKYSKVRIVVGQSNPNKEQNLQLALWLTSVSQELYPWLIADIYYGSGKYNQDLSSKALIFEMGCHKIEKEYVQNTVPALCDVIVTTLFKTTVEEKEDEVSLTIGGETSQSVPGQNAPLTTNEYLETKEQNTNSWKFWLILPCGVVILSIIGTSLYLKHRKHNKN